MWLPRRDVFRFYCYRISVSNGFWLPIGVLYLQRVREFGLDDVGLVMGGFSVAMVIAEVPTGYLGDRLGRRASLLLGNLVLATFMAGYTLVETPTAYLSLYVIWAFGWAFRSGTADAFLYELLASSGETSEFARIRGRAATVQKGFEAATAALAGVLVTVDWSLPFLANAAVAAAGIPVLLTFPKATGEDVADEYDGDPTTVSIREAVELLRNQLTRPGIRWFVAYATLFSTLHQVARDFEQPALETVGVPAATLGFLYAVFKLVAAGAASSTGWFSDRVGTRRVFALLVPTYAAGFLAIGAVPLLAVPAFVFNRAVMSVIRPLRDQYLNDRTDDRGRATFLSGVSVVMILAGGAAKLAAGLIAESIGLLRFLVVAAVVITATGGLLWVTTSPVRTGASGPVETGTPASSE